MHSFLIIQTAFTGDVVLATALAEKLHEFFPDAKIDFLVRKGNEGLLKNHPYIRETLVWDKGNHKNRNLLNLALKVRKRRYSHVINPHRFGSSGFITMLSGAPYRAGFTKNPFAFSYTRKAEHIISGPDAPVRTHEVERNQLLIADITDDKASMPALYPSAEDEAAAAKYKGEPFICIAPSSVWFTKQFPAEKWIELIKALPDSYAIYLLGAPGDAVLAQEITNRAGSPRVQNLCGHLSFLQSASLMRDAVMNYVNDSAPLHFASAVNAPVTAVFCSTIPGFGFGPLRPNGRVVEISGKLYCRPCGLHGRRVCPQGHFRCAFGIETEQLLWWTSNKI
jgi:ADP-heptose:LPS heptosyltransferase